MLRDVRLLRATLVGHPFNPIGTGRAMRVAIASHLRAGVDIAVRDVWKFQVPEASQESLVSPRLTDDYGAINIFHLNGDEIAPALTRMGPLPEAYNILVPFWELPHYPEEWARQIAPFDEVWASSAFIQTAVSGAVQRPVTHMPLATEVKLGAFRGRRHFGIPEGSYAFLSVFDGRSYLARKNPQAVVECFRRLMAQRRWARTCLVLKLHGAEAAPSEVVDFLAALKDLGDRVVVIAETLPEEDVHNLINCCDTFVSLHRSEGYGLGLAEAMFLGLPVIGTGWSGNTDFMTLDNSRIVGFGMVDVPSGGYPHGEGQRWAEPDLDEATAHMIALVDDPEGGRALGAAGSRTMRTRFSFRASGLRYAARLAEITAM